MNVDCKWVDSNIVEILSDEIDPDRKVDLEKHLGACNRCQNEIADHKQIDHLVIAHMEKQTALAYVAPQLRLSNKKLTRAAVALAATLAIGIILSLPFDGNQKPSSEISNSLKPPLLHGPQANIQMDKALKLAGPERAKPGIDSISSEAFQNETQKMSEEDLEPSDPHFFVTDAAGYSYSLGDFAGSILIFAVFDGSYANTGRFQEVHDLYVLKSNIKTLGIAREANADRPLGITFPLMTNQGSSLLDSLPGEVLVVGPDGLPYRRGSLSDNNLLEMLSSTLDELELQTISPNE